LLLAIADLAGSEWAAHARQAAIALTASDDSAGIAHELLGDIRGIFNLEKNRDDEHLGSTYLVDALCEDETKRWATHNHGQPLSARQLAKLLKPYKVEPQVIRTSKDHVHRRFYRADFGDAWKRYLDGGK
jgi:Protein of unknown function (DUF3631)